MAEYIFIIILAAILVVLVAILFTLWIMKAKMVVAPTGGSPHLDVRRHTKQHNLELILALFAKYPTLTNMIIREELGFDDRVIVNYMDELEAMGKVRQIGDTGKYVHYELR